MNKSEEIQKFYSGKSSSAFRLLGAHPLEKGFVFRLWAPNAVNVFLRGDFSNWEELPMGRCDGIWELCVPNAAEYDCYRFVIESKNGTKTEKSDPYAFHFETRPSNASKIAVTDRYEWCDGEYMKHRGDKIPYHSPINIYEVHLGSFRTYSDGKPFSYTKMAKELSSYAKKMGYTHIELLPITEYPLDESWGYQVTGWFAPTSRFGTPKDFMKFVDICHGAGVGVILDWVGAHFPKDSFGLGLFDGTPCYESADSVQSEHPEWGTKIFDYSRNEVRSFLTSSVCFWLEKYHIDGIRVDAVASMLYLDYGRKKGQWKPNPDDGNINYGAVDFLRLMNRAAYSVNPSALMIAEESSAFPMVTKPDYDGGLGFGFKWNMGWMHDTLDYFSADPLFRKGLHCKLTFSLTYAFTENFVLPFSHDEVVHGKKSLIGRMPGDYDSKFSELRLMYSYMTAFPGKKLNFMGNEFGQFIEWDYKKELDWLLLSYDRHREMQSFTRALNKFYLANPALYEKDTGWEGFQWLKVDDCHNSVIAFMRRSDGEQLLCIFNFCPVKRKDYRIGIPQKCALKPVFTSDNIERGKVRVSKKSADGMPFCAELELEPLSAVFYKIISR